MEQIPFIMHCKITRPKLIFDELIHFGWLAVIYIILAVYAFYLQQVLVLNWRRWLTNRYIDEWLKNKTYYRLQMFGSDTDNPDQRISEDVRLFVEMTLKFSIGVLKAFCTFCVLSYLFYMNCQVHWNLLWRGKCGILKAIWFG
mgnify:CR=1 FL=1